MDWEENFRMDWDGVASSYISPSSLKVGPFSQLLRLMFKHTSVFFDGIWALFPRTATLLGFCVFVGKFFSFPLLDTNTFYRKCFIHCIREGVVTDGRKKRGLVCFGFFFFCCKPQILVHASPIMHFLQVKTQVRPQGITCSQSVYGKFSPKIGYIRIFG